MKFYVCKALYSTDSKNKMAGGMFFSRSVRMPLAGESLTGGRVSPAFLNVKRTFLPFRKLGLTANANLRIAGSTPTLQGDLAMTPSRL
jgi:hypothetical protein